MNLHTLPAQILTKVSLGSLAVASVTSTASADRLIKKFDQIQHFAHYFDSYRIYTNARNCNPIYH